MQFWGSLSVVAVLSAIHLTIARWRVLRGPNAHAWLSVSAGTALAYVFAYLLPKLADVQAELMPSTDIKQAFLRNHAYLVALSGLLIYFALSASMEQSAQTETKRREPGHVVALLLIGYSFYSLQIGYLAADLPEPAIASYVLVALVLGLHVMGIDYHLQRNHPVAYQSLLRFAFTGSLVVGWAGGILTDLLESTVMLSSTFVAGGIIITAIREELPGAGHRRSPVFFLAVILACTAILTVQAWQDV